MMNKLLSGTEAVKAVKKELDKEYKPKKFEITRGKKKPPVIENGIWADLIYGTPDKDDEIVVIVCHNVQLTRSGEFKKNANWRRMLLAYEHLVKSAAKKKILVITDFIVYEQFMKEHKKNMIKDKNVVEIKPIFFPIFENNGTFAKDSANEYFTVGELIEAMKRGLIDYRNLPSEYKSTILEIMDRRGYLRKKTIDKK